MHGGVNSVRKFLSYHLATLIITYSILFLDDNKTEGSLSSTFQRSGNFNRDSVIHVADVRVSFYRSHLRSRSLTRYVTRTWSFWLANSAHHRGLLLSPRILPSLSFSHRYWDSEVSSMLRRQFSWPCWNARVIVFSLTSLITRDNFFSGFRLRLQFIRSATPSAFNVLNKNQLSYLSPLPTPFPPPRLLRASGSCPQRSHQHLQPLIGSSAVLSAAMDADLRSRLRGRTVYIWI